MSTDDSRRRFRACSPADKDALADELKAMRDGGHLRPASREQNQTQTQTQPKPQRPGGPTWKRPR